MLVLKINDVNLLKVHQTIQKQTQLEYKFDSYEPHVTLSYSVPTDFSLSLLPDFELYIDNYEICTFDENYFRKT